MRAPADGYTLLLVRARCSVNATLYDKLNFNFIRDIAPVAIISALPMVMEVNPSFPAKTVPEFIAYAKANPGKINMASPGSGTAPHVAGELFKMMTGIDMVHVPYRGAAPALTDLIGGQVQVMFGPLPASIGDIKAGKLRALAVTTATRSRRCRTCRPSPNSCRATRPATWHGIGAPKDTPPEIVDKLNKEINAALADPKIKARLPDWAAYRSRCRRTRSKVDRRRNREVGQGIHDAISKASTLRSSR